MTDSPKEKLIVNKNYEDEPYNIEVEQPDVKIIKSPSKKDEQLNDVKKIQQIANYDGMDENNKKAFDVMEKEGMESAVKYMTTDQKTGRQLSYSEMRALYG